MPCRHGKEKRRPSEMKSGVLNGGRLACKTARGTVIFCLPADRPHDPGDAADLSIMGYLGYPNRLSVYGTKFARNQKKINKFLMIKNACLPAWLKFMTLTEKNDR
jgi:hypothetical protein